MTTLFDSSSEEEIIICLRRGDDINMTDERGCTPFIYHCESDEDNDDVVIALIKYGCNVTIRCENYNGLDHVCQNGNSRLLRKMLVYDAIQELINPNIRNSETPLKFAAVYGYADIYDLLVDYNADVNLPDSNEKTALMYASEFDQLDMVIRLLHDGADPNIKNLSGNTALFLAENNDILLQLLTFSADPNYRNNFNSVPLHYQCDKPDMIETLLKFGADVNVANTLGFTPLMKALDYGYIETAKILLQYGADPNIMDINGMTSFDRINKLPNETRVQLNF